jgi:hypothetical protein
VRIHNWRIFSSSFFEESVADSLATSPIGLSVWPVCILNYFYLFLDVNYGHYRATESE